MNANSNPSRWECAGCGRPVLEHAGAVAIRMSRPGDLAHVGHVCATCASKASRLPLFQTQCELAAAAGTNVAHLARIFAALGAADVPVTADQVQSVIARAAQERGL